MVKYKWLSQKILQEIQAGKFQIGDRLPTVRKLSSDQSLSLVTAHKALADLEAQGIVECRSNSGCFVKAMHPVKSSRKPGTPRGQIRIYHSRELDWLKHFGWSKEYDGAEKEAQGMGVSLGLKVFPSAKDQPEFIAQDIRQDPPAGILLLGLANFTETRRAMEVITAANIPLVIAHHGYRSEMLGIPSVSIDYMGAGTLAMDYLIEKGCRKIALLTAELIQPASERMVIAGCNCSNEDSEGDRELVIHAEAEDFGAISGYKNTESILKKHQGIDGWIFLGEYLAEGGISYLMDKKLFPGKSCHVVAMPMDNGDVAEKLPGQVAWIKYRRDLVGSIAARQLISQMVNKQPVMRCRISPEFVRK